MCGSTSSRTRRSRYSESGVFTTPMSLSLASAIGLWKWLACTMTPRSVWIWKVSSGAHSKSMATPVACDTITLLDADLGVQ
ncbi:hypothetical protein D3C71_2087010 [compost metagenome]